VLLDLQLPYLSGQGVIAALQTTALADIPILIISGGTAESLPPEVRKEFVFIKKGTNMLDEALVAIRERIAEYRARPTGRHFI
jgi:CheY-like chemotaxis protein